MYKIVRSIRRLLYLVGKFRPNGTEEGNSLRTFLSPSLFVHDHSHVVVHDFITT